MKEAWSEATIDKELQRRADSEDAPQEECNGCGKTHYVDDMQNDPDEPTSAALYCDDCMSKETDTRRTNNPNN